MQQRVLMLLLSRKRDNKRCCSLMLLIQTQSSLNLSSSIFYKTVSVLTRCSGKTYETNGVSGLHFILSMLAKIFNFIIIKMKIFGSEIKGRANSVKILSQDLLISAINVVQCLSVLCYFEFLATFSQFYKNKKIAKSGTKRMCVV